MLVNIGGIVWAFVLVGVSGIVLGSFSVGVLVSSSDPHSARSIKCPPTVLPSLSYSFPCDDGVRGGSILLVLAEVSGMDMKCSAGGIPSFADGSDSDMVPSGLG